jgi:hypothetical protein
MRNKFRRAPQGGHAQPSAAVAAAAAAFDVNVVDGPTISTALRYANSSARSAMQTVRYVARPGLDSTMSAAQHSALIVAYRESCFKLRNS